MRGNIYGRLERLERRVPRPDPEAEAREENFRRSAAILDEFGPYVLPKDRSDLDRLIEECVPRGLSAYGLSDEEVDEEAPAYAERFKSMFRDLDAEEGEPW
jgi:hypothetical protein